jgi:hypothetical protein
MSAAMVAVHLEVRSVAAVADEWLSRPRHESR